MKINRLIILLFVAATLSTACTRKTVIVKTSSGKIPPGQAKKMTGSKSAKPYAPGQKKKG